jgi:hypothetical protein
MESMSNPSYFLLLLFFFSLFYILPLQFLQPFLFFFYTSFPPSFFLSHLTIALFPTLPFPFLLFFSPLSISYHYNSSNSFSHFFTFLLRIFFSITYFTPLSSIQSMFCLLKKVITPLLSFNDLIKKKIYLLQLCY